MTSLRDEFLEFYQVIGSEEYQNNHWFNSNWDGYNEWFVMYYADLPKNNEEARKKLESFGDLFSEEDEKVILGFHKIANNLIQEIGWDVETKVLLNSVEWKSFCEEAKKVCEHFGVELLK